MPESSVSRSSPTHFSMCFIYNIHNKSKTWFSNPSFQKCLLFVYSVHVFLIKNITNSNNKLFFYQEKDNVITYKCYVQY